MPREFLEWTEKLKPFACQSLWGAWHEALTLHRRVIQEAKEPQAPPNLQTQRTATGLLDGTRSPKGDHPNLRFCWLHMRRVHMVHEGYIRGGYLRDCSRGELPQLPEMPKSDPKHCCTAACSPSRPMRLPERSRPLTLQVLVWPLQAPPQP